MSQRQGTPGGSALGLPHNPEDDEADPDFTAMFSDEAQPGDVEDEQPQEDEPSVGVFGEQDDDEDVVVPPTSAPADPAADPALDEAPEGETAAEEQARLYAGRYQSVEQLEDGYKQLQRAFTDIAQTRQASDAEVAQLRAEQEQVRAYLLQQAAEADPELAERIQREQQLQQMVDQRVREQVEPLVQPIQQREAVQQVVAQAQSAIQGFYQRHGIQQGDERDVAALEVVKQTMSAGYELDISNPQHLDWALDVVEGRQAAPPGIRVPQLAAAGAGPAPVPGATVAPAPAAPGTGTPAAPKAPVRRRVETHVETGGSGAPASAAPGGPKDEFDEAVAWYEGRRARGPLFGSQRT